MRHGDALRASVRAEYGVSDLRAERVTELADLVAWLPAGCAFWKSVGGPMSLTDGDRLLRMVEYRLQLVAWLQSEDSQKKRNQPKPPVEIPYRGEKDAEVAHAERQYAARLARERSVS